VNVFVDGFNFYYGCFRSDDPRCKTHSSLKWVNPRALAELIYPNDNVKRIHYCTARVGPGHNDPDQPIRQTIYLNALETVRGMRLHFGQYKRRDKHGAIVGPSALIKTYPIAGAHGIISTNEEKGSDVNVATYLLESAFTNDCDIALVISNDSDLEEAVRVARTRAGIEVHVLSPYNSVVRALQSASTRHSTMDSCALGADGNHLDKTSLLRNCQFPPVVVSKKGVQITKPRSW
jgi:uncharacterized LabA/DUF88 family protein